RLVLLLLILGLSGGGALATATASTDATRTICHRTASKKTPYVRLRIPASRLKAHVNHAADIIPAPRACTTTLLTPKSGGLAFQVALTGEAETPAGDPVGTGAATFRLRAGQGQVCYVLDARTCLQPWLHTSTVETLGPPGLLSSLYRRRMLVASRADARRSHDHSLVRSWLVRRRSMPTCIPLSSRAVRYADSSPVHRQLPSDGSSPST